MVAQGVAELDAERIKSYVLDLRQLLDESEVVEKKAFLKSFIKRIVVDRELVTIH